MADTEREDRARRRAAVQREMSRLRSTDDSDEAEDAGDSDSDALVDAVDETLRREREVADENSDAPS